MTQIAFLAGMPRSGSTLLRGFLSQDPGLRVTPYSGLCETLTALVANWGIPPHQAYPRNDALDRVAAAVMASYHPDNGLVNVDLCRDWPCRIEEAERALGRRVRIVCPVRAPVEVIASLERLHIANPYDRWARIPHGRTVEDRVHIHWDSMCAGPYSAMVSALDSGLGDRLLFVDYHKLLADPELELRRLYRHWGLDYPGIDPGSIELLEREDDAAHGMRDLHALKPVLAHPDYRPEDVLGKRLTEDLAGRFPAFWERWT